MAGQLEKGVHISYFNRNEDIAGKQLACYRKTKDFGNGLGFLKGEADRKDALKEMKILSTEASAVYVFDLNNLFELIEKEEGVLSSIKSLLTRTKSGLNTPTLHELCEKTNVAKEKVLKEVNFIFYRLRIKGKVFLHKNGKTFFFKALYSLTEKIKNVFRSKPLDNYILRSGKMVKNAGSQLLKGGNLIAILCHGAIALNNLINDDKKTLGEILGKFLFEICQVALISIAAAAAYKALAAVFIAGAAGAIVVGGIILAGMAFSWADTQWGLSEKLSIFIDQGIVGLTEGFEKIDNMVEGFINDYDKIQNGMILSLESAYSNFRKGIKRELLLHMIKLID